MYKLVSLKKKKGVIFSYYLRFLHRAREKNTFREYRDRVTFLSSTYL